MSCAGYLCTDGTKDILLTTRQGMAIRFDEEEVRPMGRNAAGSGHQAAQGRRSGVGGGGREE